MRGARALPDGSAQSEPSAPEAKRRVHRPLWAGRQGGRGARGSSAFTSLFCPHLTLGKELLPANSESSSDMIHPEIN